PAPAPGAEERPPEAAPTPPGSTASPDTASTGGRDDPPADRESDDDRANLRRLDGIPPDAGEPPPARTRRAPPRRDREGEELPFGDRTLGAGSRTREVVAVLGAANVEGRVDSDAVSVLG